MMRVLVSPLDWGLGHATRCIPIIDALIANGHEVVIAAGGPGYTLLKSEFPDQNVRYFPNYQVRYSRSRRWFVPMIYLQVPGLLYSTFREHYQLQKLRRELAIDFIISDNRYGLYSRECPCIIISHQLFIRSPRGFLNSGPAIERLLLWGVRLFFKRYAEVWVPDFPDVPNISGDLSHKPNRMQNVHYIGLLTRFQQQYEDPAPTEHARGRVIDLFASVSGVEPQRTLLEELLREQMGRQPGTRLLVIGKPGEKRADEESEWPDIRAGELNILPHLSRRQMEACMRAATTVVCRSGYTTVMELAGLAKNRVLFIPTPGQTEQEYLGEFLEGQNIALNRAQEELDLARDLPLLDNFQGFGLLYAPQTQDDGTSIPRPIPRIADIVRDLRFLNPPRRRRQRGVKVAAIKSAALQGMGKVRRVVRVKPRSNRRPR